MKKKYLIVLLISVLGFSAQAQERKFGKVTTDELKKEFSSIDSLAHAEILYTYRSSYYAFSTSTVELVTKYHQVIKIYDEEGYEYATHKVQTSNNRTKSRERFSSLKAYTYNLEGGKGVKTKLDKEQIFQNRINDYSVEHSFTMPDIKPGSVLEWTYEVRSPFIYNIDDMNIQSDIPTVQLIEKVKVLEYFKVSQRQTGYMPFLVNVERQNNSSMGTTDVMYQVNLTNIPAYRIEPYVDNIHNYLPRVVFEVAEFNIPGQVYEKYSNSWKQIVKDVYEVDAFAYGMKARNFYLEDLEDFSAMSEAEKMVYGLTFVRSRVAHNKYLGKYPQKGIRGAYSDSEGNGTDMNLLLVSVYRAMGLNAYPVLIGTRSRGVNFFPTADGLNHTIAVVFDENNSFYLMDASSAFSSINVLPERDLNGKGFVVLADGNYREIPLSSSRKSNTMSMLNFKLNADGSVEGKLSARADNHAALNLRNKYGSIDIIDVQASYKAQLESELEIVNFDLKDQNNFLKPFSYTIEFNSSELSMTMGDKIIMNPMIFLAHDENEFKSEKRDYPVDYGTPFTLRKIVTMELPEGYVVEEIPEPKKLALPDNLGSYSYSMVKKGNSIRVNTVLTINNYLIANMYYPGLKQLYDHMVESETSQIILNKQTEEANALD
jgi:hypothetical protein